MLVKTIAKKYALALYEISKEKNKIEEIKDTVSNIALSTDGRAYRAFSNPKITLKEKEAEIRRAFGEKLSKEMVNFLALLIEKKRFKYFTEIAAEFKHIYDENHGFKTAGIKSAFALSEEQRGLPARRDDHYDRYGNVRRQFEEPAGRNRKFIA
jgi:F-type H+-transporting ATPase subunit delta